MNANSRTLHGAAGGFTLIELLIVIAILGTLAAVLLPGILGASDTANETKTETTMVRLKGACEAFERKHGYFPPDDLRSPEAGNKLSWKPDNGQNTGIESLVAFTSQSLQDGVDLGDLTNQIVNTDQDDHGAELPLLRRKDRAEVADAWGTPFAYFGKFGMQRPQLVTGADGESMPATARLRADGTPHGAGKYQILSAGKDRIFGTGDDLVWPKD